jgi:hypothetical protein
MSKEILDTVLLLALPASGKSELRRYIDHLPAERCKSELHMGHTAQLDDFPYVHLMRRIDEELTSRKVKTRFFKAMDRPFIDARDWLTLVELVNEDFKDLKSTRKYSPDSAARFFFERLDEACGRAGAPVRMKALEPELSDALSEALEGDARKWLAEKQENMPESLDGRTLIIEFARGGSHTATMPLPAPWGYAHSVKQLSDELLSKSVILYVWVTPEESRRKNEARADPDDPGSILHHGVPLEVLLNDYGCDDVAHLMETSDRPGTVRIEKGDRVYHLPVARFDNRVDKTSFIRDDPSDWPADSVKALHDELKRACQHLAGS